MAEEIKKSKQDRPQKPRREKPVKIDDGFQQKLLGMALMIAGWFTGGAASALGKVALAQKINEKYQKSYVGQAINKTRQIQAAVSQKLNKWAGK